MKYVRITITTVLVLAIIAVAIFFVMPMLQQNAASPPTTPSSVIEAADFVVAASDSQHKEQADYVCDGISDDIEIQAAINALPPGGGTVLLLEGTYIIDGVPTISPEYRSIIILKDNVSVVGYGLTTILKLADGYTATIGGIIGNSEYPTLYDNVRIANLKVDGNRSGAYGAQVGIYLHNAADSIVENCSVISCAGSGIQLYANCYRCTVQNNIVQGCGQGINLAAVFDCVVAGNTVQDIEYYNILLGAAHRNTIRDNVLIGGKYGIGLIRASSNNTIVGNTIEKPKSHGIEITAKLFSHQFGDGAKNNVISENIIYYCGHDGIHIVNTPSDVPCANDHNIITNNTIRKSKRRGISIASDHNLIENNSVLESSQETNNEYDGIFLYAGASYNEIAGNVLSKGTGVNKPRYGINISDAGCVGNVVRGNDLRDSGHTGNFNDAGTNTKV